MIRQAISCDICATEKKQTNHWFVAFEQSGELRLSGWNYRNKLRPGMKHLCGQTCLHKLVDEFMARSLEVRPQHVAEDAEAGTELLQPVESSLTEPALAGSRLAGSRRNESPEDFESSARVVSTPAAVRLNAGRPNSISPDSPAPAAIVPPLPHPKPAVAKPAARSVLRPTAELVAMPSRLAPAEDTPANDSSRYASRNWRAEAWDRERERELRAVERRPEAAPRRRVGP